MVQLQTTYLGLELPNPLVASASPLSKKVEHAQRLEEAGVAALVMYSLFEEQIVHESLELDHYLQRGTHSFAESLSYLPDKGTYSIGPDAYLEQVYLLKQKLTIPVIGSLNGFSTGGWINYATLIEQAGADALELNIYYLPTDVNVDPLKLEDAYVDLVRQICAAVRIPVAIKLSPYFTSLPHFCQRLVQAGANGLVLFNRFYQPDFDLELLEVRPNLVLSTSAELRLPLRWIALMYGQIAADFALTSGVHTAEDIVKAMMAGARVAMSTSALLHHGPLYANTLLSNLASWMEEREYESIRQMQGSMSQKAVADPAAFERANYMRTLSSFDDSVWGAGVRSGRRANLAWAGSDDFWGV